MAVAVSHPGLHLAGLPVEVSLGLCALGVPAEIPRKLGGWTLEDTAQRYDHDVSRLREAIGRLG